MTLPRATFNVATFNRTGECYGLLVSIFNQSWKEWDIVIIDDSENPIITQKYIADLLTRMKLDGHKVTYIHNPIRQGIGKARNQAVALSETELIARVDDDSILDQDWLKHLIFRINGSEIGAVGGIVPPLGMPQQYRHTDQLWKDKDGSPVFNRIIIQDNSIQMADDGGNTWDGNPLLKSHHLRSSFLFRKSAWEKVKGFPIEYGNVAFREETDFCLRLLMAGYKLYTVPQALNFHGIALSGGCRDPNYVQQVQICHNLFERKFLRYLRNGRLNKEVLQ